MKSLLTLALLGLLLTTTASSGQESPKEKPLTPAQQARIRERDRLGTEIPKLRAAGKLDEAIAAIEQLLVIEREVYGKEHLDLQAIVLTGLGEIHEQREDLPAARKARQEVLALRTKLGGADHWQTTDARLALADVDRLAKLTAKQRGQLREATQLNDTVFQLWQQGKSAEAVPLALKVVATRKEVLGERHRDYALGLFNLAAQYKMLGDYAKAGPLYRQVAEIDKAVLGSKHPRYAASLDNLAALYQTQGDYGQAEPLFQQALEITKSVLGPKHPDYIRSLNNLAALYSDQGQYGKAEPLYRQVLAITEAELGREHPRYASTLNNLAGMYQAQKEFGKAEPLYRQALELTRASLGEQHPDYAQSLHNLAVLYDEQEKFDRAEPLYRQALALEKDVLGDKHPLYANTLHCLAGVYLMQGDLAKAETMFRDAILAEAPGYRGPFAGLTAAALRLEPNTVTFLGDYSCFLRKRLAPRPTATALRACDHAHALTLAVRERLRREALQHDESKLLHGAHGFDLVPDRINVLRRFYQLVKQPSYLRAAFTTVEQGRARGFLEQLGRARAGLLSGLTAEDRARESDLLGQLRRLEASLEKLVSTPQPDAAAIRRVQDEREQVENQLQQYVRELEQKYPQYAALRYPKPCTIAEARACLAPNEVALLFALGRDVSAVVLLDATPAQDDKAEGIAIYELPSAGEINEVVASLTDPETLTLAARVRTLGNGAYAKLLAPLAERIRGKDLVIVPGESLCYLPFELLPEDGKYLIEQHHIRYAPSLTALHMIRQWEKTRATRPDRTLFAVGDPVYDEQDARLPGKIGVAVASLDTAKAYLRGQGRGETFARLENSGREVEAIGRLLKAPAANLLVGPHALEGRVKAASASGELARCRYVHFATHGILGSDTGKPPALVLSLLGNDDELTESSRNDGFLRLDEVTGLKLNADLVVLSACRSGQGKLRNGEGVSGLARAFLYAGSRGVVCSLWSVADAETAELMIGMYGHLKAGQSSADALRTAKLDLLRAGKPPIYWAPFILIGE